MISNLGIDIIENERIDINNNDFINCVLTKKEKEIFNLKKGQKKLEYLCGRFTAKEAIIKALNDEKPHMQEIEILNKKNGAPYAIFKNYKILISISHEKNYTIAIATILI